MGVLSAIVCGAICAQAGFAGGVIVTAYALSFAARVGLDDDGKVIISAITILIMLPSTVICAATLGGYFGWKCWQPRKRSPQQRPLT
jgi:hypothetical protein